MEYAKEGIRVNAVAPGVVATPMHRDTPRDVMEGLSPMGRSSSRPGHYGCGPIPDRRRDGHRSHPVRRRRRSFRPLVAKPWEVGPCRNPRIGREGSDGDLEEHRGVSRPVPRGEPGRQGRLVRGHPRPDGRRSAGRGGDTAQGQHGGAQWANHHVHGGLLRLGGEEPHGPRVRPREASSDPPVDSSAVATAIETAINNLRPSAPYASRSGNVVTLDNATGPSYQPGNARLNYVTMADADNPQAVP